MKPVATDARAKDAQSGPARLERAHSEHARTEHAHPEHALMIDAHQHFWRYVPSEFPWMSEGQAALKRDHLPSELKPQLDAAGVHGTVAVQARQMHAETDWLLDLAAEHYFVRGVVGWFDLAAPDLDARLESASANPYLVGIRELIHDMPRLDYAVSDEHVRGVASAQRHGLTYDLLLRPEHLRPATLLVDRLPDQRFVIDHIAKPPIHTGELRPWADDLRELALRPNVYCKLSGLVTEATQPAGTPGDAPDLQPTLAELQRRVSPYLDVCLELFGPSRLMLGSDWPVCTLVADYRTTMSVVGPILSALSEEERARVLGATCVEFYRLPATQEAKGDEARTASANTATTPDEGGRA